jgi:hypothetical protein
MKKKMLAGLILLALIGVGVAYAQQWHHTLLLRHEVYRCVNTKDGYTFCDLERVISRTGANVEEGQWKQTTKPPSNTGACRHNPSRLSTAHNFRFVGARP